MSQLYDEVGTIYLDEESTRESYENLLYLNYESILEQSHGSPTYHAAGGSSTNIYNLNPRAAFYNLFSCSSARFTVTNNLICTYVYSGDYGLGGVGTTKTGSMLYFQNYYNPMGDGDNMGQAFIEWFELYTRETTQANYYYNSWFMGMTIQGDPTLRPKTMGDPSNEPGQASNPNPANTSTGVDINADLSWSIGTGATSHDVYFGTDSTPDVTEFQENVAETTYDPGVLETDTTYYWRIDEKNASGTTTGVIWHFTTASSQAYATLPYSTGFESGSLDQYWATHCSTEFGRIQVTNANTPHSGTYHLTMDVSTSGTYNLNEAWLHLDLSGETNVDLSFWWKEFNDETHTQDGVYFSDDGGTSFVKVYNLTGGTTTYIQIPLDIDQLASANGLSLTNTFVVKFQQYDNYPITTDGFAFDDIEVTGQLYASLPYKTGFESGSLDRYWTTHSSTDPGRIQVTNANTPHSGRYHLTMDVSTSGTYNLNEAWLHLDLSGKTNVDLSFWWKEFYDETHTQDGVYFSDDGGASFVKVYNLTDGSTTYTQIQLDIDQLARANRLSLTNTFVVKFQQYDNYPITTDGFAFDDISVTSPIINEEENIEST
jgi:hypothetical protein